MIRITAWTTAKMLDQYANVHSVERNGDRAGIEFRNMPRRLMFFDPLGDNIIENFEKLAPCLFEPLIHRCSIDNGA